MKVRNGFVSNSSSSSFILKDAGFFKHFGISKQDMHDAIVELMGGKEALDKRLSDEIDHYEKMLAKAQVKHDLQESAGCAPEACDTNWSISFCKERLEKLRTKGLGLFCVYDMTDKADREECYREWDAHFETWFAPNVGCYEEWTSLERTLTWKCNFTNIDDVITGKDSELETCTYDSSAGKFTTNAFPGGAAFMKHVKRCLKVETMKEVLHDRDCTLMIHFDDNEVGGIRGMQDDGKPDECACSSPAEKSSETPEWESESWSSDRFFEILIKHFIAEGRIDMSDPWLLEHWKVSDDDMHFKKNYPGKKYYLDDDTAATWKEVTSSMLDCSCIMHEG